MAKLPRLYQAQHSDSSALFLDIIDAWFSGTGPSFAKRGLSKDGAVRKKIGIVLLCNRDGFPLRWETVEGSSNDGGIMTEVLEEIKNFNWVKGVPLVCDRAMGRSSLIQNMHEKDIIFLTALARSEYTNYAGKIPISNVDIAVNKLTEDEVTKIARSQITKNKKFVRVDDDLYTTDVGLIDIMVVGEQSNFSAAKKYKGNRVITAMQLGREIKRLVTDSIFGSITAAGASLGLKPSLSHNYHHLTHLPQDVQDAILDGKANNCSAEKILTISKGKNPQMMHEEFYKYVDHCNKGPKRIKRQFRLDDERGGQTKSFKVRVVAYFNPQMYADQRLRSKKWLDKIEAFAVDLNRRLSSSNSRRTKESVYAEIDRFIRKKDLLRCFKIKVDEVQSVGKARLLVTLILDEQEWAKRRSFDGVCVLVAHPDTPLSATELCQLYRSKDVVEKDFQTIKSVLEIRPIRHRSDEKVKAHVTICMLALLLERILRKKLGGKFTVDEALESLHTCHLNKYKAGSETLYTITETDEKQRAILKTLNLLHLADDDYFLERIHASLL